jgi:hypothetical protein
MYNKLTMPYMRGASFGCRRKLPPVHVETMPLILFTELLSFSVNPIGLGCNVLNGLVWI